MLLKHCLEQGVSQSELARRFGIDRTTIWRWVRTGQLDRDLSADSHGYSPRPPAGRARWTSGPSRFPGAGAMP